MKNISIFFLVISMLLIFGCANVDQNVSSGGESSDDTDVKFPPSTPKGIITVDNQKYELRSGDFRWERTVGDITETEVSDAAAPPQIAEEMDQIVLQPDTIAQIEIENIVAGDQDEPDVTSYLWSEEERYEEVDITDNQITLPSKKGHFIYEIIAEWLDGKVSGEVSYTFVIEVQ